MRLPDMCWRLGPSALLAASIYGAGWAYVLGAAGQRPSVAVLEPARLRWSADESSVLQGRDGLAVASLLRGEEVLALVVEERRPGAAPRAWVEVYASDRRGRPERRLARHELTDLSPGAERLSPTLTSGWVLTRAGQRAIVIQATHPRSGARLLVWERDEVGGLRCREATAQEPQVRWRLRAARTGWTLAPSGSSAAWRVRGGDGGGVIPLDF